MIDTVFENQGKECQVFVLVGNQPIIGRLLDADYWPADNRPLPYQCISRKSVKTTVYRLQSC